MKYFTYDPSDSGMTFFETAEKRDEYAKQIISEKLNEGWCETVEHVQCGVITHKTEEINVTHRPDSGDIDSDGFDSDNIDWSDGHDYICNYAMKEIDGSSLDVVTKRDGKMINGVFVKNS